MHRNTRARSPRCGATIASETRMNETAWFQGSGIAAHDLWWTIASIGLALTLLVLATVVLSLFDRTIWAGMDTGE